MLTDRSTVLLGVGGTWATWFAGLGADASTILGAWMPFLLGVATFAAVVLREVSAWRRGQLQRLREQRDDAQKAAARDRARIADAEIAVLRIENQLRSEGVADEVLTALAGARESLSVQ